MHVYMSVGVQCVCVCVCSDESIRRPLLSFSVYSFEVGSLSDPGAHFFWARLEANNLQRSSYFCPTQSKCFRHTLNTQLVMGVLGSELSSS